MRFFADNLGFPCTVHEGPAQLTDTLVAMGETGRPNALYCARTGSPVSLNRSSPCGDGVGKKARRGGMECWARL